MKSLELPVKCDHAHFFLKKVSRACIGFSKVSMMQNTLWNATTLKIPELICKGLYMHPLGNLWQYKNIKIKDWFWSWQNYGYWTYLPNINDYQTGQNTWSNWFKAVDKAGFWSLREGDTWSKLHLWSAFCLSKLSKLQRGSNPNRE